MSFKLLTCDGGGIRGLMTSMLIADLDDAFGIVEKADGFAGTSTGGLIALGLANNVPISKIVEIYKTKGSVIFEENGLFSEEVTAFENTSTEEDVLGAGPGKLSCQYTSNGLKKIAEGILGNQTMSDAKKYVAVNSARLWDGKSWEPATISSIATNAYSNVKMVDAALSTAAAPTYFPPHLINNFGYFADGGVYANNPTLTAITDALSGGIVTSFSDISALSLGTGFNPVGVRPETFKKYPPLSWGISKWFWYKEWDSGKVPATALLGLMMDCTSDATTATAQQLLQDYFCRANVPLPKPYGLDDWQNVADLEKYTKSYMATKEWQGVRHWVKEYWG